MKIFTYGTLMRDGKRNDIMRMAQGVFLYNSSTNLQYHKGHNSFFPYVLEYTNKKTDYVTGEVFIVPDVNVHIIDAYESTDDGLFYRKEVLIGDELVYMYFMNSDEI